MKLKYITVSLFLVGVTGVANAATEGQADGTVNITGKVVSQTCEVTNGNNGNIDVTLPTVSDTALAKAGETTGATAFNIKLKGCTAATGENEKTVGIYFSGINIDSASGTANNTNSTDPATNVNVQLLSKDGTAINLSEDSSTQISSYQPVPGSGETELTFDFAAQYYAIGVGGPGSVYATIPFVIAYQ